MPLSSYAIEQMGFRRRLPEESIAAEFHSLVVYEVQGINLENDVLEIDGAVGDAPYKLALASSINAACRKLLSDDLSDDEDQWKAEHKCTPPFILIHIGPTTRHSMTGDYLKVEPSSTVTYEGFIPARIELRGLETAILPSVMSALTCAFSTFENSVKFRKLTRQVFGRTPERGILHDFGIEFSGSAYVSRRISSQDAAKYLKRTQALASTISPKVSRFFHLALEEDDRLKRFLYFFLTIERQTHSVFASVDHSNHIARIVQTPERARAASLDFFERQLERSTPLRERFIWCTLSVWTHLSDADVETFTRLKKVRDEIAHGKLAAPPYDDVVAVERLATKLQVGPDDPDGQHRHCSRFRMKRSLPHVLSRAGFGVRTPGPVMPARRGSLGNR